MDQANVSVVGQLIFSGVSVGSIYALVALAFVLIYRATNVINFAQGSFSMLAAYIMVAAFLYVSLPYWLAFVLTLVGMAVFGTLFAFGVYHPLRNRSFMPVIVSTIGASIVIDNGVLATFGPRPIQIRGVFEVEGIRLGGIFMDTQYAIIIAVAFILVVLQYLFFEHTLLGKKMQAVAQDKEMASLLGIPVTQIIALTFALGAVIGGIAGVLISPIVFVTIGMAANIIVKAFAATIIGGFGDVTGAIAGGLLLGLVDAFGAAYISVPYKDAFGFGLLILFLLARPQGIFGERMGEKA